METRRYEKAPIVEAVIEVRWETARTIEDIELLMTTSFRPEFGEPKQRRMVLAQLDLEGGSLSQEQTLIGYQMSKDDGSEIIILETGKFAFIQPAPYDRWEKFSARAVHFIELVSRSLQVSEYSRVGVRFANRIDVPKVEGESIETDDFVRIKFDGPRHDIGRVDEFQMRIVKPTEKPGISYALYVATVPSPLAGMESIAVDIDVFSSGELVKMGTEFSNMLNTMREEKNSIFESCLTEKSRMLFGGERL